MKNIKYDFIRTLTALILVLAMIFCLMPINAFASETVKKNNTSLDGKDIKNGDTKNLRSVSSSLTEVYLDGINGAQFNDGTTAATPVRSLEDAINRVQSGGTIYCLDSIVLKNDLTIDGKGATLTYTADNLYSDSLLKIQNDANVTITNLIIDGKSLEGYIYDMVYLDSGNLTLGEGTIIQNAANNNYGAALGIYEGATANLCGTKIINNRSGVTGGAGAHAGGVTVEGILNISAGTVITDNQLFSPSTPTDILLSSSGEINLDGSAQIGTIAFKSIPTTSQIFVSSELKNNINLRMHNFFNYTILLPDFKVGNILASGKDGYTLTDTDKEKLILASPNLYVVKLNSKKEAYVDNKLFKVIVDENIIGGTVTLDKTEAANNEKVILTPQPKPGYKYKTDSLRAYQEGHTGWGVTISTSAGKQYLNIPKSNVVVLAEFDKIPATIPTITANLPIDKKLTEGEKLELTVQVEENLDDTTSYQWYKGTDLIDGETLSTLTLSSVDMSDAGEYYVKVIHTTAAGETASINSNTCVVSIIKKPHDIIFNTNIDTSKKINEKDSLELSTSVTGGDGIITYQWYKNGLEIIGETQPTLKVSNASMEDAGSYYVKVTNTNAYGISKITQSNHCEVTVVKLPSKISISLNLDPYKTLVDGDKLELMVTTKTISNGVLTYQWYKDGIKLNGATNNTYTVKNASKENEGSYYVKLTNSNALGVKEEVTSNSCLVRVATKKVTIESTDGINGQANLETLWDVALSDSEKEAYKNGGVDAFVYLKMSPLNNSNDEQYIYDKLGSKKMGSLLDISIFKKIGNLPETTIKKSNQEISITIDIPEKLRATVGTNRRYYIIRVHHNDDGTTQTDTLNDIDNNPNTITFKTNLFSTYALIYEVNNESNIPTISDGSGVDTSDNESMTKFIIISLISVVTFSSCVRLKISYKKKKSSNK